jgi:hypothetical protein
MTEEPVNLVLEHLRHIRAGVDALREDMRDVKRRGRWAASFVRFFR